MKKERSWSLPTRQRTGSESLGGVARLEESSSFPLGALTSNLKEPSGSAACLSRKGMHLLFPPQAQTRNSISVSFSKEANAAVLSLSGKDFLWPGLPDSRDSSGTEYLGEMSRHCNCFIQVTNSLSFVPRTSSVPHLRLTLARLGCCSVGFTMQICEGEQD